MALLRTRVDTQVEATNLPGHLSVYALLHTTGSPGAYILLHWLATYMILHDSRRAVILYFVTLIFAYDNNTVQYP